MYDFIVIGAGFGGLSAAALLSKKGKSVLLIEKSKNIGGRAFYFESDGYVWQYGQHSHRLGSEGHASLVIQRLGDELDFIKPGSGKAMLFYKGELYKRPEGPLGFLTTKALSFSARIKFLKFYKKILSEDSQNWYDKTLLEMYRTFNKENFEVEEFLNFLGFTIMLPDVSIVSAGEVIDFLKRVDKAKVPVADTFGSSKQIIDKLKKSITDCGGKIVTGEKVTDIILKEDKITGVATNKENYESKNIVYAAPVKHFFDIIDKKYFKKELFDYSKNIQNSGGVVIDFVSDEPLADLEGGILGVDEPLWVKFQTILDPTVAPAGKHVCSWGLLTDWGKSDDPVEIEKTEKRLREIADICMPGYKNKVIKERKMHVPVVNSNMLIPSQSKAYRNKIKSEEFDNLYFVGDTTEGDGCSGDIAFSSALKLDDMIQ